MRSSTAIELRVLWGDQLLRVAHVAPPRDVWVGDDAEGPVDFVLPLPRRRVAQVIDGELVLSGIGVDGDGGAYRRSGDATLRVRVSEVEAAESPPAAGAISSAMSIAWACSAAVHLAVLAGFAAYPSDLLPVDTWELCSAMHDPGALATLQQLEERASKRLIPENSASGNELGAAHARPVGTLGAPTSRPRYAHFTIEGPRETTAVKLARARALIESGHYGALTALEDVSSTKTPGPFGGDDAETLGTDARSVVGNLFGGVAGEAGGSGGFGGLGLAGGGGNIFSGIGVGEGGVLGGCGCGWGSFRDFSYGRGVAGSPAIRHETRAAPRILDTGGDMIGKLPPEVIKRVIRANFPRFRRCYERGLASDPTLAGTVVVRLIVDATGAVETASLAGGTLDDATVRTCVLGVYATLSFPDPESGKVFVTYPIDFQPG